MSSISAIKPLQIVRQFRAIADPSEIQKTEEAMRRALQRHDRALGLSYDVSSKMFTVLNSSKYTLHALQRILNRGSYPTWEPEVTEKKDEKQNFVVVLKFGNLRYDQLVLQPMDQTCVYRIDLSRRHKL
jgi:hypothetical protein